MKRIISMAVVLVITMAATAQKGELAMNENISGKTIFPKRKRSYSRRQKAESGVYIRRVWRNPDYQTSV